MRSRGRPRLVSPALLAEAATDLFLERGYHQTSVDDVASRAGVSRATFFNYFPAKADVLFWEIDSILTTIEEDVATGSSPLDAISYWAAHVTPLDLPLIANQSEAMDVWEDVGRLGPARVERLRRIIALEYPNSFDHWVLTGALVSAAMMWARTGGTTPTLIEAIEHARQHVAGVLGLSS